MPTLSNLLGRRVRTSGANPATKEQAPEWSYSSRSLTGATVNDTTALSLTPVFAAIRLIANTVGGFPIHVFEQAIASDGTKGEARNINTPETYYLWGRPNPEMVMQQFWSLIVGDEVRGNAFIFVEKGDIGEPIALWYLDRQRVRVGRASDRRKVYEIDGELPMIDYKQGGEIVHIPNWGGALVGYDPIKIGAQAIAMGLSAEEYAARAYSQGQIPPGILSTEQPLTTAQADALQEQWERKHGGVGKAGKIAVLGNGATFKKVSLDLEEMQNEAARKWTIGDAGRLFGYMPPFLLGDVERASQGGGNGLEEQNRNLTSFNFNSHMNRIQQAVSDDLLVRELTFRYMRMNPAALLRGNTLQRYQAYRIADFMTINEKRALEELPPVDGGDVVLAMTNLVPLDRLDEVAMNAGGGQ